VINQDGPTNPFSMTIELNGRCGYDFIVDNVIESKVVSLTTKFDLHLMRKLIHEFLQPGVVS
jgi:hypothetical protein